MVKICTVLIVVVSNIGMSQDREAFCFELLSPYNCYKRTIFSKHISKPVLHNDNFLHFLQQKYKFTSAGNGG